MKLRDNGDTAFPFTVEPGRGTSVENHYGMSLRDWFAGQVIATIVAEDIRAPKSLDGAGRVAVIAYEVADAMLEARKS